MDPQDKPPKKKISRLRSGCWTCRRRGYKCDEAKPHCKNCVRLNLNCEGYGIRLKWQDDGYFNQSQIASGKSVIGGRTSRKRSPQESQDAPLQHQSSQHLTQASFASPSSASASAPSSLKSSKPYTFITAASAESCFADTPGLPDPHPHHPDDKKPHRHDKNKNHRRLTDFASRTFTPIYSPEFVSEENPDGTVKFLTFNGSENSFAPSVQKTRIFATMSIEALTSASPDTPTRQKSSSAASSSKSKEKIPSDSQKHSSKSHHRSRNEHKKHEKQKQHQQVPNQQPQKHYQQLPQPQYPIPPQQVSQQFVDTQLFPTVPMYNYEQQQHFYQQQQQQKPPPNFSNLPTLSSVFSPKDPKATPPPLSKINIASDLLRRIIIDLGDKCTLSINQDPPGKRMLVEHVAENASYTKNPKHPFNKYSESHKIIHIKNPSEHLPFLPNAPIEALTDNPAIIHNLTDYFKNHMNVTYNILLSGDYYSRTFARLSESFEPLRYAVASLAAQSVAHRYLINERNSDSNYAPYNRAQYELHSALSVSLKIRALNRLGAAIFDGVSEKSLACILILSNIEMGELNFEIWGRHLEGAAHGIVEFMTRHGDPICGLASRSSKRYQENVSETLDGSLDVFLSILEIVGIYDIMWTVSTDSRPRLQDLYLKYWRYIPGSPSYPSTTPYNTAVRYLMTFLAEITGLSTDIKSRESMAIQNPFMHLSGTVSHFYCADQTVYSQEDIDSYLDIRNRINAFGPQFLDTLPRIPYLYPLIKFIYCAIKVYFVLRLDNDDMSPSPIANAAAAYSNINASFALDQAYHIPELKHEAFQYLHEINPYLRSAVSHQSVQDYERFLLQTQSSAAAQTNDFPMPVPPPMYYDPSLNVGVPTQSKEAQQEENVDRTYSFQNSIDPVTQMRGCALWMMAVVAGTEEEQQLLRENFHELYSRVPKHSIGYLLEFCELMWKLKPAADAPRAPQHQMPGQSHMYDNSPGIRPDMSFRPGPNGLPSQLPPLGYNSASSGPQHMLADPIYPGGANAVENAGDAANAGLSDEDKEQQMLRAIMETMLRPGESTIIPGTDHIKPEYLRLFTEMSRRDMLALIVHTCGPFISI